jgi:hypothetical protein
MINKTPPYLQKISFVNRVSDSMKILEQLEIKSEKILEKSESKFDAYYLICDDSFPPECGGPNAKLLEIIKQFEDYFYCSLQDRSYPYQRGESFENKLIKFKLKEQLFSNDLEEKPLSIMCEGSLKLKLNECFFSGEEDQIESIDKCQLAELMMILMRGGCDVSLLEESLGGKNNRELNFKFADYILGDKSQKKN